MRNLRRGWKRLFLFSKKGVSKMKKIMIACFLCLTSCAEDDKLMCSEMDGGTVDSGCLDEQIVAFPDLLK